MKTFTRKITLLLFIFLGTMVFSSIELYGDEHNISSSLLNKLPLVGVTTFMNEYKTEMDFVKLKPEKFLPSKKEQKMSYSGFSDYEFESTVSEIQFEEDAKVITLKNSYIPKWDDSHYYDETTYIISDETVIERQKGSAGRISQINEMIILKNNMTVGTSWNQEVPINGNQFQATTEVTDITKDSKNRFVISLSISVKNFGKEQETYLEKRSYTEGLGLSEFQCKYKLSEGFILNFTFSLCEK